MTFDKRVLSTKSSLYNRSFSAS